MKVETIRKYIDGDFSRQFAEVLSSMNGPIFYHEKEDRILITRWASVLLGVGQNSKDYSPVEEKRLKEFAYNVCVQRYDHEITPSILRQLGQMGNTGSENSLSSKMLTRWEKEGLIRRVSKGKYRWVKKAEDLDANTDVQHIRKLLETSESTSS